MSNCQSYACSQQSTSSLKLRNKLKHAGFSEKHLARIFQAIVVSVYKCDHHPTNCFIVCTQYSTVDNETHNCGHHKLLQMLILLFTDLIKHINRLPKVLQNQSLYMLVVYLWQVASQVDEWRRLDELQACASCWPNTAITATLTATSPQLSQQFQCICQTAQNGLRWKFSTLTKLAQYQWSQVAL